MAQSINLLLPPSKGEIQKVKIKSGIDISGIVGVFIFVLVGVVILIFSLYYKNEYEKYSQEKNNLISEIKRYEDVNDLKGPITQYKVGTMQRLINDKWNVYQTVGRNTVTGFIDKIKLLESLIPYGCETDGYNFSNDNTFSFSGRCRSYQGSLELSDKLTGEKKDINYASVTQLTKIDDEQRATMVDEEYKYEFTISGEFTSNTQEEK